MPPARDQAIDKLKELTYRPTDIKRVTISPFTSVFAPLGTGSLTQERLQALALVSGSRSTLAPDLISRGLGSRDSVSG